MQIPYLNKLNFQNKSITIIVLLLLVNLVIIYFATIPTVAKIKSLHGEILNLKIDSENKITREKNMNDLNDKIKKISPQLEKINQIFINKNREIEFITTLESLEEKNNVQQTLNLDINNSQKGEGFNKVPIEISATGNFENLTNYLLDIETLNYYINFDNILIQKTGGDSYAPNAKIIDGVKSGDVSLKLTGYTYWK